MPVVKVIDSKKKESLPAAPIHGLGKNLALKPRIFREWQDFNQSSSEEKDVKDFLMQRGLGPIAQAFLKGWSTSSKSTASLMVQYLLMRDFNVPGKWVSIEERTKGRRALSEFQMGNPTVDLFVFAQTVYLITQRQLMDMYPRGRTITLHRGIKGKQTKELIEEFEKAEITEKTDKISHRALSSWSNDIKAAKVFAGMGKRAVIVTVTVPLHSIFLCHSIIGTQMQEGEFIVMPDSEDGAIAARIRAVNLSFPEPETDEQEEDAS